MQVDLTSLLSKRSRYLVAVSGGRDSVCLLHLLVEQGFSNLTVCHLNHQLRGLFSNDDAAFVRNLSESLGLPFEIGRLNVRRLAEEGKLSLEAAARAARHEFFAACAERNKTAKVLLAHHADDNAETVLFNLLRGSAGLRGMSPLSKHKVGRKTLTFLRPLLGTRRREIDDWLEERQLDYRDDHTNDQAVATRNRLRLEALPLLDEIMGRDVTPAILRASAHSRESEDCLTELLNSLDLLDPQGRLFLPKLRDLPEALQRRTLFDYLSSKKIPDLSSDLLDRCLTLLDPAKPAKQNLPRNRHLRRRAGRIFVD